MATITLGQLLGKQTLDSIRAKLLAKLQGKGLPTTDWSPVGPERTFVELFALGLEDLVVDAIPAVAAGEHVDYAVGDWLTLLSAQRYNNTRYGATPTQGTILLSNSTSSSINVGVTQLWFKFPSGNRYKGPIGAPVTVPANGSVSITVESEGPNHSVALNDSDTDPIVNYVDGSGLPIEITTPIPGLTATNAPATYSPVVVVSNGTGTLTPTGSPSGAHSVTVRIDVTGEVGGTLVYSYSVDGGAFVSGQTAASQSNIGGTTIGFTLTNGSPAPSFKAGATLSFTTPGSWITQQGTDAEYDPALASRDKNRWPTLSALAIAPGSPPAGFYDLLARQPIGGATTSPVTQTLVLPDPVINNQVDIFVAGQGGALPGAYIAQLQAYLNSFNMVTDRPVVLTPASLAIVLGGLTITVVAGMLATAQASLQASLASYFAKLGMNASSAKGLVKHAKIVQIIEDTPYVTDVTDTTLTINGVVGSLALPTITNAVQLPVWSQNVATDFAWVQV